jgi:predicted alpha/beta-hydrolase family hydrolase
MTHPFLEGISRRLAERAVATFRYQFPYVERGRRGPDPPAVLVGTVRAAVTAAAAAAPDLPLLVGGKSLGGRMTSTAVAEKPLPDSRGIVFLGFPLHAPGKPGTDRADHLQRVGIPMLFLQGSRDAFGGLDLLTPICKRLGERATLHVLEGADHGFRVPRSSGRTEADVLDELADVTAGWIDRTVSTVSA